MPNLDLINKYLSQVHERSWITNNGPLVRELTSVLQDYLGVKNLILTANGTLALQLAYKALRIKGEALTTPFTFVATASSMKWQGITPRFCDIEPDTLGLCPQAVKEAFTPNTKAIVPVHVYGNPCNVEKFEDLSEDMKVPVIYDASHTFSIKYKGQSILNRGDASTISFHATKLFHTVEGGGIVFKDDEVFERARLMLNFGLGENAEDIVAPGINAKMSEVHAAYGLSVLHSIDEILSERAEVLSYYHQGLNGVVELPRWREGATQNAAYAPIIMDSENQCLKVLESLKKVGVVARRYFYPSLHHTSEYKSDWNDSCKNVTGIANRVICLPLYPGLEKHDVANIVEAVKEGCQ
ncbi:DegT/DnrJ/EryC1/StrS family aminotransferase [Billgrantia kenyensis]|nr:DegT/DnrJ/EryC1/StrS family aminotransferase [Halomonas kenyensis]